MIGAAFGACIDYGDVKYQKIPVQSGIQPKHTLLAKGRQRVGFLIRSGRALRLASGYFSAQSGSSLVTAGSYGGVDPLINLANLALLLVVQWP